MKTVIFCGQQNIALRGHQDSALDVDRDVEGTRNHGNFIALLKFRIDAGDTILENDLSAAAQNATYTSNIIQNQIIIRRVVDSKWFTVIADEVTDVSNREQLSIVLRYVDNSTLIVREDQVVFIECDEGISGRDLADKITGSLKEFGLDLQYLRGQAYDGVGNMQWHSSFNSQ